MKKLTFYLLFLACQMAVPSFAQNAKKVLFIGIDGVRSDALQARPIPNLRSVMNQGLRSWDCWHLGVTSSGPSWSTMLTGVWEAKHGVQNNTYSGSQFNTFPYFPKRAKELRPNLKAVQICTWSPMTTNIYNDGFDQKLVPANDNAVVVTAKTQLLDPNLDVLFVHFDVCDITGHGSGFNPNNAAYNSAIDETDNRVGQILQALYARPNYQNEDWLIMCTTDHGGTGTTHGGNTNNERQIWWFAAGGQIPQNIQLTGPDPGSYNMASNPVNVPLMQTVPVLADIAVTALDHLVGDLVTPATYATWNLDGKSWINGVTKLSLIEGSTEDELFTAYPNPNNGSFMIRLNQKYSDKEATYRLINSTGQVVETGSLSVGSKSFDLTKLTKGIYHIELQCGNKRSNNRIVLR